MSVTENQQCANKTMPVLTVVNMYNKAGAMSLMELPVSNHHSVRINERTLRDAVSSNHQEVMAVKTHWDRDKSAFSFALSEVGGGVNGRVKRDGATNAAWLIDSCLFTPEFSEGPGIDSIEA